MDKGGGLFSAKKKGLVLSGIELEGKLLNGQRVLSERGYWLPSTGISKKKKKHYTTHSNKQIQTYIYIPSVYLSIVYGDLGAENSRANYFLFPQSSWVYMQAAVSISRASTFRRSHRVDKRPHGGGGEALRKFRFNQILHRDVLECKVELDCINFCSLKEKKKSIPEISTSRPFLVCFQQYHLAPNVRIKSWTPRPLYTYHLQHR